MELGKINFIFQQKEYMEVVVLYESFRANAEKERRMLFRTHREFLRKLSTTLTEQSLHAAEEAVLQGLAEKEIISPKLVLKFEKSLRKKKGEG